MAYYSDPAQTGLFPGYSTDEGNYAVFPADTLPTCSGVGANLNDIKEVLYSILSVVENNYASLPAYASGVDVQTKALNFNITSNVAPNNNATVNKTYFVTFTLNAPTTDVANENEYNPD